MHTIAATAVALAEAETEEFLAYARQIVQNARRLAECLVSRGFDLVTGGTDNHLILIDMRPRGVSGKRFAKALDRARIVANFNTVPGDPAPPANPNGLRLGTPAITTRGMREEQMELIADLMQRVAENIDDEAVIEAVGQEILMLCSLFPVPEHFIVPTRKAVPFTVT